MWIYKVIKVGEGLDPPDDTMHVCALAFGKTKELLQGRVKTLPYRMGQ